MRLSTIFIEDENDKNEMDYIYNNMYYIIDKFYNDNSYRYGNTSKR